MAYKDQDKWAKMSVLTVARMGTFSSDRSIREHNEKIWHATPLKIDRENE
jgi:starch phosphorylase